MSRPSITRCTVSITLEIPEADPQILKSAMLNAFEYLEGQCERIEVWTRQELVLANAILLSEGREGSTHEELQEEFAIDDSESDDESEEGA